MVICCYTRMALQWTEQELSAKLALLPDELRAEALKKKQWMDKQLSIAGKLLVLEVIRRLGYDKLSLSDLKYDNFHRPYFEMPIDFNIAHSGNLAICCGTDSSKIGVDLEQIKEIDISEYLDHFTPNEWKMINDYPNPIDGFYEFWSRKEAVLKAIGTGIYTPLQDIDVSDDLTEYKGIRYYLYKLHIGTGYSCYVASTIKQFEINPLLVDI